MSGCRPSNHTLSLLASCTSCRWGLFEASLIRLPPRRLLSSRQDFGASVIRLPDWILSLRPSWSHRKSLGSNQAQSSRLDTHPGRPTGTIRAKRLLPSPAISQGRFVLTLLLAASASNDSEVPLSLRDGVCRWRTVERSHTTFRIG